ncbi:hypothetical protein FGE12_28890 [Aggregicoccus sp. 17bor-14]|uniref:hypothetical protein n=1 Tax=Myxococcaceae TaxID=31 RepID=UPI00129C8C8F|nr:MULTISPECIES: hypothetical protein [Myxococcaceae]MBF5046465.1 hypothetical protein [Simulacricoccus sp. 17bor-14]MRI92182.1 hypothetical protein [Aggregicoccus sp. 17bor-14]
MAVRLVLAGRYGGAAGLQSSGLPGASAEDAPLRWLERVQVWVAQQAGELLEGARMDSDAQGRPVLRLQLHPAAEEVSVVAAGQHRVVVVADTTAVGPGYHRYLCELLHRLGGAFSVAWADAHADEGVGDPTGYFHTGDAAPLEGHMLAWLADTAGSVLALRSLGHANLALSLRPGHAFDPGGAAVLTPMGPRDEAWVQAVHEDPARGRDVFPWWEEGTGPRVRLGRALSRLWTEMVWRPPLLEEERRMFRSVARLLESAWREDPSLAYPWREWRELLGFLGVGGTLAEEVSRQALQTPEGPRIGYRRGTVQVTLPQGWAIRIPGSLAEAVLPDGSWVARDHRRSVRVLAERGLPAALEHGGEYEHKNARVTGYGDVVEEGDSGRLTALCDAGDRRALCIVTYDDLDEKAWALETWRTLDVERSAAPAQPRPQYLS